MVKQVMKLPKDIIRVMVTGETRGKLLQLKQKDPYLTASVEILEDHFQEEPDSLTDQAMEQGLKELFLEYASRLGKLSKESIAQNMDIRELK